MKLNEKEISGLWVAETCHYIDHRGAFSRLYCENELSEILGRRRIMQINHSRTLMAGAVRGMHYQNPPHAEMKLVRCMKGRVWDVALDLRRNSPTFLMWHAEELSPGNGRVMIIPEGCAHGFQVLEQDSELLYFHTSAYTPGAEGGVSYADPLIDIKWPLPPSDLSARDLNHSPITLDFRGIQL